MIILDDIKDRGKGYTCYNQTEKKVSKGPETLDGKRVKTEARCINCTGYLHGTTIRLTDFLQPGVLVGTPCASQ